MNTLTAIKTENDDFQVEYEILSPIDISTITDQRKREIALALQDVNKQIDLCEEEIAKLSTEIEKLTNHADGIDYAVAVASGVLTGLGVRFLCYSTATVNPLAVVGGVGCRCRLSVRVPQPRTFLPKVQLHTVIIAKSATPSVIVAKGVTPIYR